MFEGMPTYPDAGRFWEIIDKYQVNIFYTAPTVIRSLAAQPLEFVDKHDLSSLRVLGSVGEPIDTDAWHWYFSHIGKEKRPIVDTWWQTETGAVMIAPTANVIPQKPSYASLPLPGIEPLILDDESQPVYEANVKGNLCLTTPWPSLARTIVNDHDRFIQTYFQKYPGKYFTGDGAWRDEDGYIKITGRVDDVINVSAHRIGTAEMEDIIDAHDIVVESAVVGFPHTIKGEALYAFVVLEKERPRAVDDETIKKEIILRISKAIGSFAKPDKIQFVPELPKTRSGKIMRRILRKIAAGEKQDFGDTTTLVDESIIPKIVSGAL